MGSEFPCQFNQKSAVTICAKWDTSQNQPEPSRAFRSPNMECESWRVVCVPSLAEGLSLSYREAPLLNFEEGEEKANRSCAQFKIRANELESQALNIS